MSAQERSKAAKGEAAATPVESEKPAPSPVMSAASPFSVTEGAAPDPELQRIREILFGEQVRTLERRLGEIEERFARSLEAQQKEQAARLAAIEGRIRTEAETMGRRLEIERTRIDALNQLAASLREEILAERRDRVDACEKLSRKIDDVEDAQPPKFAELKEKVAKGDVRDEDLAQSIASIDQALRELREKKMDRSAFAALLGEMTAGLTSSSPPKPNE